MKKFLTTSCCVLALVASQSFAEEAPDSVKQLVPALQDWGKIPGIVSAVKSKNASGETLDQVKQRDGEWRETAGIDAGMKELMENQAAQELLKLESSKPYFFELFLMDNQGANIAMTNKTSDYWQGDEAKFTESFKGGQGAVHLGDVEFDESAQAYLVQVSIPVVDGGSAIGAMTIGINIDVLEGI